MDIRRADRTDLPQATALAEKLWTHAKAGGLEEEMAGLFDSGAAVFFLAEEAGRAAGFASASLRHDYVEGASSPVGYLEGILVDVPFLGRVIARALLPAGGAVCEGCGLPGICQRLRAGQ